MMHLMVHHAPAILLRLTRRNRLKSVLCAMILRRRGKLRLWPRLWPMNGRGRSTRQNAIWRTCAGCCPLLVHSWPVLGGGSGPDSRLQHGNACAGRGPLSNGSKFCQYIVFLIKLCTIYRVNGFNPWPYFQPAGRSHTAKASTFRCYKASVLVNRPAFLKGDVVMSNYQDASLDPPRRRRGHSRPSILDHVRLADGRLAWPVAKAAGIHEATFRARLKAGVSPDEALRPVRPVVMSRGARVVPTTPPRGRPYKSGLEPRLADGRLAQPLAKAAGVSAAAFHHRLKAGWSPDEAIKPVRPKASDRRPQA